MESRLAPTVAIHLIVMTLKLLAQDRHCLLTPPSDDEEAYNIFCESVHKIQKMLTDESRASRIMNRSMKIANREEKLRRKHKVIPMDAAHPSSLSLPQTSIVAAHTHNNAPNATKSLPHNGSSSKQKKHTQNTAVLEPIATVKKSKKEKQTDSSPTSNKESKKKTKTVGFSSPTHTHKQQNDKQLGPYVAHSTDVSKPGGASSILRAKTPLILDRPSNIRDRMALGVADPGAGSHKENTSVADDGSTTSSVGGGGGGSKSTSKKRDAKEHRLELCPVQLDEKGKGLRYDLRYRVLASFINVLSGTRKVSIDDVIQAFWAKKQCETGVGLDIISENGVIVDRNSFVEGRLCQSLSVHSFLFTFMYILI